MIMTVATVLRTGGDFTPGHVTALAQGVSRWWPLVKPLRFVVLTDDKTLQGNSLIEVRQLRKNWPGWWSKMELFAAQHDDLGHILYFDLDTLIVGPLDDISENWDLTLLRDFYHPDRLASGMMLLPKASRPEVHAGWMEEKDTLIGRVHGDGNYLDSVWRGRAQCWQDKFKGQVISYKADVRQRKGQQLPADARVVCFHGRPRPWETKLWASDA